ncbi:MAG: adenine deaminase C-terminal domain-containing protein [Carnobacterium sp.]|uniref:adenine deaminase C-terminal domain-containing protein n=1 Tax=Carnobacterium sp. TaxID=48221 RepID=UPI002FC84CE0
MTIDLLITNANVFNTFLKTFELKNVAIQDGKFFYLSPVSEMDFDFLEQLDAKGKAMIPGLIDIHLHIESSMIPPSIFSKVGLTHGVTTIVADSHEIANVFGIKGIQAFLAEETEMDIFYAIPSSVPSTTSKLETTGGTIGIEEVRELLADPRVIALGEAMNFKGITSEPDSLIRQILRETQTLKPFLPLEGHIPRVSGIDLAKFMFTGITADHTHQTPESIYEKISSGMFIELQKKSLTKENLALIAKYNFYEYLAIITDDIMADDLLEGHLNANVKLAIECGMPVEQAIYTSTYTPARRMGFQDRGAIASGFIADFILLDDVKSLDISAVYKAGKFVHTKGEPIGYPEIKPQFPENFYHSLHCKKTTLEDFKIPVNSTSDAVLCNVIRIQETSTFTEHVQREIPVKDGYLDWETSGLALLMVMERYGKNGNIAYALVENAISKKGAIATTWAHDHHNLMVMGTAAADMMLAQHQLLEMEGGYVVIQDKQVSGSCPLPIGGILSDKPIQELGRQLKEVRQGMVALGYKNANEIMSFSTLSLPVSPNIKITDVGMMDVRTQELIPLMEG